MIGNHDVPDGIADVADEALAPIIKCISEPSASRERLKLIAQRIEAKILSRKWDRFRCRVLADDDTPAVTRPSPVQPVIEAPFEIIHQRLDVEFAKTTEHATALISATICICILEIPHVWRRGDEQPAP
jgi:hypothetical protein